MKVVNHVVDAVCGNGIEGACKRVMGAPVVSSDIAPFNSLRIKDLKLMMRVEDSATIADVERTPVDELTLCQLKALRLALHLTFRITASFVRDLNEVSAGQPVGMIPIHSFYAVALRHPRGTSGGFSNDYHRI